MKKLTLNELIQAFRTRGQYLTKETGMRVAKWGTWYQLYGKGLEETMYFNTVAEVREYYNIVV